MTSLKPGHSEAMARYASAVFPRGVTIEMNERFHDESKRRHKTSDIRFLLGDSAIVLPGVVADLVAPAMFWLDHHAGANFFAEEDNCSLIAELNAIAASPCEHLILVDDARAFVAPPPLNADFWPALVEVLDAAHQRFADHCAIICDALIFAPDAARATIAEFCNTVRPAT